MLLCCHPCALLVGRLQRSPPVSNGVHVGGGSRWRPSGGYHGGVTIPADSRRQISVESEAFLSGVVAALAGIAFSLVAFWGRLTPLWGAWSVGAAAAWIAGAVSLLSGSAAYVRSRDLPGQEWRRQQPLWRTVADAVFISLMHVSIVVLGVIGVFLVLQRGFRGLRVDGPTATVSVAVFAGVTGYVVYVSMAAITTRKLAVLLVSFVAIGALTSMATAQNPQWWEMNFSALGMSRDISGSIFNLTLIVGGIIVFSLATYVGRDVTMLVDAGRLRFRYARRSVGGMFAVMGIMLTGVGLAPVNVAPHVHNFCAAGMALAFGILLLSSPLQLRGMPWAFFGVCGLTLILLASATYLYAGTGYYNLTAFELIAFALIFGWLSLFIRFIAAMQVGLNSSSASSRAPAQLNR